MFVRVEAVNGDGLVARAPVWDETPSVVVVTSGSFAPTTGACGIMNIGAVSWDAVGVAAVAV